MRQWLPNPEQNPEAISTRRQQDGQPQVAPRIIRIKALVAALRAFLIRRWGGSVINAFAASGHYLVQTHSTMVARVRLFETTALQPE